MSKRRSKPKRLEHIWLNYENDGLNRTNKQLITRAIRTSSEMTPNDS